MSYRFGTHYIHPRFIEIVQQHCKEDQEEEEGESCNPQKGKTTASQMVVMLRKHEEHLDNLYALFEREGALDESKLKSLVEKSKYVARHLRDYGLDIFLKGLSRVRHVSDKARSIREEIRAMQIMDAAADVFSNRGDLDVVVIDDGEKLRFDNCSYVIPSTRGEWKSASKLSDLL